MIRNSTLPARVAGWAFFAFSGMAAATTWHVQVGGSGNGSAGAPFGTWQQAIDVAQQGDLILIGSGSYPVAGARREGVRITSSGSAALPITLRGAGAGTTRPRLDCQGLTHVDESFCLLVAASHWRIENVSIGNIRQSAAGRSATGIRLEDSSNVILNTVESSTHQGVGVELTGDARNNLLWNVDAHHNHDPLDGGQFASGIAATALKDTASGNRIIAARAWANSAAGFDLGLSEAAVTLDGNLAFRNGFVPDTSTAAGNGNGFRLGPNELSTSQHRLTRNFAFANRAAGFNGAGAFGLLQVYNNTGWNNGGQNFLLAEARAHVLRNNLSVGAAVSINAAVAAASNSWQLAVVADNNDFLSIDPTGLDAPRAAGGLLPVSAFLRLRADSDLVNAGSALAGTPPFEGPAPDLGADERPVSLFRNSLE